MKPQTLRRPFQIHRMLSDLSAQGVEARFRPLFSEETPLVEGVLRFQRHKLEGAHPWIEFDILADCQGVSPPAPDDRVEISFTSHLAEGYCRFQSDVLAAPGAGHSLRLAVPRTLERFQRRVAVRVRPPEEKPLYLSLGNGRSFAIRSLSVRGLGFVCPAADGFNPGDHLSPLRINDDGGQTLTERTASVREVSVCEQDLRYVSVVFDGMNLESEETLRRYMLDLVKS